MEGGLWPWLRDWTTRPGFARLKPLFRSGRASFLTARVESTRNAPEQGRLFAHYRLATGPVLGGGAGLTALEEHLGRTGEAIVCLRCSCCRREYVVAVAGADDPLGLPAAPGGGAGYPASYSAGWFRFWHPGIPGEPSLDCPHCEQRARPECRRL